MAASADQLSDEASDDKSFFVNSEGLNIFCKYWYPQSADHEALRAAVFICHGAGNHCQAQSKLASRLNDCNMLVFAHDHVGHGLSEGERMMISDFNTYCKDVVQHVRIITDKHPNIPIFAIGHSMGGAIAVKVALENADIFAGLVLLAPAIILCPRWLSTSAPANFIARGFSNLFPRFQAFSISPQLLSHDPQIVQSYIDDPLVWHGGLKTKWLVCFLDALTELRGRFGEFTAPFFVLQGTDDKLCDPAGSQMFYDNASSAKKQIKMYPGGYHQIHNESGGQGEEAVSDLIKWITDSLTPKKQGEHPPDKV